MAVKIEGAAQAARREQIEVKKPAAKPAEFKPEIRQNNTSVNTNRAETNERAVQLRTQLNARFEKPAAVAMSVTPQEAETTADEIIERNGGRDNLDTDAVGRELAEIARTNPADANAIAAEVYADDRIKEDDRDEVAQSFAQEMTDGELATLAESGDGQTLLRQMEENLLQRRVHEDESADANRIRAALDTQGIFLGSEEGMYPEGVNPVSISEDPDATPEEVAAYIKYNPESTYSPSTARYEYLDAIAAHQNDPQWLADFHSALGSDLAGDLISATLDPTTHHLNTGGADPELPLRQVEAVRNALETMVKSGVLTQEGMNNLIGGMRENPYIATELFAHGSDQLKSMFVTAAVNDGADSWDAGALHVLNTMSAYRQEQILNGMGENLEGFIQGAMRGEREMLSFSDYVRAGLYGASAAEDLYDNITYGGVEKLLDTANRIEVYYHAGVTAPAFSEELQQRVFNAVTGGLTNGDVFEKFAENTGFKDELSLLFMRNRDALLANAQKNSNGFDTGVVSDAFENGLEKFFQMTLMTPPKGERYEDLAGSVFELINEGVTALSDPALANRDQAAFDAFKERFGMEPTQYAQMLGGVLGSVMDATGFAQEAINSSDAQREETIKFYTGLAFAMIPGVGPKIGGAVGNSVFKHFVDKGVGYFQTQAQGNIRKQIEDLIGGRFEGADRDRAAEMNSLIRAIFDEGLRSLPNGASVDGDASRDQFDFQGYFQRGYNNSSDFTRFDDAIND